MIYWNTIEYDCDHRSKKEKKNRRCAFGGCLRDYDIILLIKTSVVLGNPYEALLGM